MSVVNVAVADIGEGERLRAVDPAYVTLFALQAQSGAVLPPVQVRRTPNGKKKFLLVSGAHRLAAARSLGREQIEAVVVKLDAEAALEQEIAENLFRHELTVLQRAAAVAAWKRLYEAKKGPVRRGNPQLAQLAPIGGDEPETNLLGLAEASQEGGFFARLCDRLGLSRDASKRLLFLAAHLHPDLKGLLAGREEEDNQSFLLRLSRLEPNVQQQIAAAIRDGHSPAEAEALITAVPAQPASQRNRDRIIGIFGGLGKRDRVKTLAEMAQLWPEEFRAAAEGLQ